MDGKISPTLFQIKSVKRSKVRVQTSPAICQMQCSAVPVTTSLQVCAQSLGLIFNMLIKGSQLSTKFKGH